MVLSTFKKMMANKMLALNWKMEGKASTVVFYYFTSLYKDPLNIHSSPFVKTRNGVKFIASLLATVTFSLVGVI